ncbi:hypothetical protein [Caballeronia sp. HLA56]
MPHHAELPQQSIAGHARPANDPTVIAMETPPLDLEDEPVAQRAPLRFGRLALWSASAGALAVGVLGTIAYSMWFSHDQRVYAEAMSSARQTLGVDQPTFVAAQVPARMQTQTQAVGTVEAAPVSVRDASMSTTAPAVYGADTVDAAAIAAAPTQAAPTVQRPSAVAATRPPSQTASARGNRAASAQASAGQTQAARRRAARARTDTGLFARVGAFFHRVSYRRNATAGQREEYSRP